MDLLQMPVRLVVKAPNQQIEDQMVECALDWTVQKLKAYLSEAYPNKPKAEEQKLIYSGQLLHDHLMLKDFLRQYEAEKIHTVHLVCVPPRDTPITKTATNSSSDAQRTETNESCPQSVPMRDTPQNDGLRYRNGTSEQTHGSQQYTGPWPYPHAVPQHMQADLMAQQMAWIQQMYVQYMHMCLAQLQGGGSVPLSTAHQTCPRSPSPVVEPNPQPEPNVNENEPVERRPANNVRLNAQGVAEDDDEDVPGNWDWLDWFYFLSRATVLFSFVYFYSSLSRFVLVMLFAAFMYFFRRQANGNNRRVANRQPARAAERLPRQDERREDVGENEAEQMHREIREIVDLMNQDMDETNQAPNQGVFHFNALWTFITTFFSSLLPEQPDQLI